MLGVSLVTTAWSVLRLRIEETASRNGGSAEDKIDDTKDSFLEGQQRIKFDDMKDSFYEELECVFGKFPKYHMKILLGDFTAKVGMEDIFNRRAVFSVGSS
jgi:hypothetical protein